MRRVEMGFMWLAVFSFFISRALSTSIRTIFPESICPQLSSDLNNHSIGITRYTDPNGTLVSKCACWPASDNSVHEHTFNPCPVNSAGPSLCTEETHDNDPTIWASCGFQVCSGGNCLNDVNKAKVNSHFQCPPKQKPGLTITNGRAKCSCSLDEDRRTDDASQSKSGNANFISCPGVPNGNGICAERAEEDGGDFCEIHCSEGYYFVSAEDSGPQCVKLGNDMSTKSDANPHFAKPTSGQLEAETSTAERGWKPTPKPPKPSKKPHQPSKRVEIANEPTAESHPHQARAVTNRNVIHFGCDDEAIPDEAIPDEAIPWRNPKSPIMNPIKHRVHAEFVSEHEDCYADERKCPHAFFSTMYSCVALDNPTQCGGCHSENGGKDCTAIVGVDRVSCLRDECVVHSCLPGFSHTSESQCSTL